MKKYFSFLSIFFLIAGNLFSQSNSQDWYSDAQLTSHRLPPPPAGTKVEYVDLDGDGDPDLLKSFTTDYIPVLWIDDDDDMQIGDLEGDTDSDCLMIDRNKDGQYGSEFDLILDWNDETGDNQADMQAVIENGSFDRHGTGAGNYMWVLDTDGDEIFNYINWKFLQIKGWDRNGISGFFTDYHGQSIFLKIPANIINLKDLRYNWENPFLFYDYDQDGYSEMSIRMLDTPEFKKQEIPFKDWPRSFELTGKIDYVALSFDLDNDNGPSNELDFDMSLRFTGPGFDYRDQIHKYKSMRGLAGTDSLFHDARWRQISELFYPDHDAAWDLTFKRGVWNDCWFVFDEDDDCYRFERVEFYEPEDMFKIGPKQGGIDNHRQSDMSGDRGEWDEDFSGMGKLYISRFDGRIHLYGAEWGAWRIDQEAQHRYHLRHHVVEVRPEPPESYATVKYSDTDDNGFFDLIEYDLNGDTQFEKLVSLKSLGISDECELIQTQDLTYNDFFKLHQKVADQMWEQAEKAVEAAGRIGVNVKWYSFLMSPRSIREKYHMGYWLQFYLYRDIKNLVLKTQDTDLSRDVDLAYFQGRWELLQ